MNSRETGKRRSLGLKMEKIKKKRRNLLLKGKPRRQSTRRAVKMKGRKSLI